MKKVFFLVITVILLCSCSKAGNQSKKSLNIVCTTGMIADTVKNIGGPYVSVKALMGPGVDPHLYKARAKDMTALQNADIIFYNGLHLEAKMAEVLEQIKKRSPKKVHSLGNSLPKNLLIAEDKDIYDPHVWMAPLLWKKTLSGIKQILITHLPSKKDFFSKQVKLYSIELKKVHTKIQAALEAIPKKQRVLITAHDAFAYLGREYGIKVMGIQGISTASEASVQAIQKLATYIVKNKIPSIFTESSVSSKSIQALQEAVREKGFQAKVAPELYADALGSTGTEAGTYIGMLKHNARIISEYLKK